CSLTACRVTIRVDDAGFTTGVAGAAMSYTTRYRVVCRKNGRRTTCLRSRRGSAELRALDARTFTARLKNLPRGSSTTVSIRATDKAGNTQPFPTTTVLRTKKPSSSR
ncbi:MAG TPA: hypothetical protein VFZ89_18945, partial [Solirubrobacteraceae bacterium]